MDGISNYRFTVKAINFPAFLKSCLFLHSLRIKQVLLFGQDKKFEYRLLVCKIQRSAFYTRYAPLIIEQIDPIEDSFICLPCLKWET
jgi:hypothetical protein